MKNLGLIKCDDEMFGNEWNTTLIFSDNSSETFIGQRPIQYAGVHGLVNLFQDEFHLLMEDDGRFWTFQILTKDEITMLHSEMKKLETEFIFKGQFKVKYKNQNILKNRKSGKKRFSSLEIIDREQDASILRVGIKGKVLEFDVNWLPDLVSVLGIN
jgi:translation initiation factor IF-1